MQISKYQSITTWPAMTPKILDLNVEVRALVGQQGIKHKLALNYNRFINPTKTHFNLYP